MSYCDWDSDGAAQEPSCVRCHRTALPFFFLEERPYCAECCDAFTVEELLRFTHAASVCDLLYDLGFVQSC